VEVLRNVFRKKFPKYLEVSKICFIFASLFRFNETDKQKGSQKNFLKKVFEKFGGLK
jgi:hypothetical protein